MTFSALRYNRFFGIAGIPDSIVTGQAQDLIVRLWICFNAGTNPEQESDAPGRLPNITQNYDPDSAHRFAAGASGSRGPRVHPPTRSSPSRTRQGPEIAKVHIHPTPITGFHLRQNGCEFEANGESGPDISRAPLSQSRQFRTMRAGSPRSLPTLRRSRSRPLASFTPDLLPNRTHVFSALDQIRKTRNDPTSLGAPAHFHLA